jgi:urease accessory protein
MLDLSRNSTVIAAANLLLVADGRFPAGGYAHSFGLEQAIERGGVHDDDSLRAFLVGNLATAGRTAACFAAATCETWRRCDPRDRLAQFDRDAGIAELASEQSVRIPSAPLRDASRAQGRQFMRAAAATWPTANLPRATIVTGGVHLSMAQGLVSAALDLDSHAAALLSAYSSVTAPAAAAVKLLGLDPFTVNRMIADLGGLLSDVVEEAGDLAVCAPADQPCRSAPLLETGSELHAVRQPRMFAS